MKKKRGRPFGTGINDKVYLRQIEQLALAHPGVSVTTLIRSIGIDHPSEIRRLREKSKHLYNEHRSRRELPLTPAMMAKKMERLRKLYREILPEIRQRENSP